MTTSNGHQEIPEPSPAELARLQQLRAAVESELPDLIARDQLRKESREEASSTTWRESGRTTAAE
jgi:hypothetical protein